MSALDSAQVGYIDPPSYKVSERAIERVRRNMSKANEPQKIHKIYAKTRTEHTKDIIIAVLVTAIVAFVGGVQYQSNRQTEVQSAVHNAVSNQSEAPAAKK